MPPDRARRLARQHLARRAPAAGALDVVSDIAGLHAQLMPSAELTLWARVDGLARDAVATALWQDRTLVKTWAMRGTLHLLPADELPLYVAAQQRLKPRHHGGAWLRHFGLTRAKADALVAAIPQALDGEPLTREELAGEVARLTGQAELRDKLSGGFGDLLKPAAFAGDLCFAPSDGQRVRFTRPDRWLDRWQPQDPDTASTEVARRYLATYGPATREQFARWFGMTSPAEAARWLRSLGDQAAEVEAGGATRWQLTADLEEPVGPSEHVVGLLPAFDQYVVGAGRDDEDVLAAEQRTAVYRPQGWISPVLVVDGRIQGVWRHERAGDRLDVAVEPFAKVTKRVRAAVDEEARRLAAFLGGQPQVRWVP